jgi:hypothetical protein
MGTALEEKLGIPTPTQAAENIKSKHDARVKAAMDKLRPHVVQAMNSGKGSVALSAVFNPRPRDDWYGQGGGLGTNNLQHQAPVDTYVDVAREAAALLSAEIEAQGWTGVTVMNDELSWCERPSLAEP